jgi:hypothetical protein
MSMPRGSILLIEAKDLLAAGTTPIWNKVTEHNRSEFTIGTQRIESKRRMSNGTLRKYYVADKKSFNLSWEMLPSYRNLTVDGAWGAEDLREFYEDGGTGTFRIRVNMAKTGTNQENIVATGINQQSSGYEEYNVSCTEATFTIVKRGIQPHWNVSLSLEEV